jgi:hypothetical protein
MTFKIWQKSFPDFESASKHKVGPGFNGSVYLERSLQAAEESLKALKSGKQVPYFHKQRNEHLPIITSMGEQDLSKLSDFSENQINKQTLNLLLSKI